jgi:hypothetical protein
MREQWIAETRMSLWPERLGARSTPCDPAPGPQGRRRELLDAGGRTAWCSFADNGTVVAGDWSKPDDGYFGLSLADVAKALEP